ncbi:hypothetical protein ElyMa_003857100 [Elysia marginata]|uniref:Endonuclease/exonuclease/phosphatase domain-containing protein n=1 Tax=Elysia marginata TaxID=1093978 RepID=A0AAV4FII2_9GAST|nr:hypothetical protein ElyMa_003857100 [Elysia marginata]
MYEQNHDNAEPVTPKRFRVCFTIVALDIKPGGDRPRQSASQVAYTEGLHFEPEVKQHNFIVEGDLNINSPSWGYNTLGWEEEKAEDWDIDSQLILLDPANDPPTFNSVTWRTSSISDIAFATEEFKEGPKELWGPSWNAATTNHLSSLYNIENETTVTVLGRT